MTQIPELPTLGSGLAARAAAWSYELTAMPSVTGTRDEVEFAEALCRKLRDAPVFATGAAKIWTIPVEGDPLGRASVAVLVRGTGDRTLIMTGHYDTVHYEDYGPLAELATKPQELREALSQALTSASGAAEIRAQHDLESGEFLPGRGLLDMKSGLAAGLAVAEAFAADPEGQGNILFLAVPDEEVSSAGARSAAVELPEIAREHGLVLEAAINLDALLDDGDGSIGRAVALGTIGKLLPSALVIGRPVHAANALAGVNAGLLAAALVSEMEWALTLSERTGDELGPPPTLLGLKDNRIGYDVTTPDRVWAYWNVMTHRRGPGEVLDNFAAICRRATEGILTASAERAETLGGNHSLPARVDILRFDELRREVLGKQDGAEEAFAALGRELAATGLDVPEQCRRLTEHVWEKSGRAGPAIVIGLASWPYLPTSLSGPSGLRLDAAVRRAAADISATTGQSINLIRYFPGISDMSFLGQTEPEALSVVAANTPAWGFSVSLADGTGNGIPMINAGPWGRDYHTRLERLHLPYAFEILPRLLLAITRNLLTSQPDTR